MPNNSSRSGESRYQVKSVARAAHLLDEIANQGPGGLNITEIAERLGVAKSTALALAHTLTDAGLLRTLETGPRYVLGLKLLRLGDLVGQQTSFAKLGLPILAHLSAVTGMTSRLAANEDGYPVFVERIDGEGSIRFHAPLGQREQPHATAAGKAILAYLSESNVRRIVLDSGMPRYTAKTITDVESLLRDLASVRSVGYGLDDEEEADGVFCVGAAFFDHQRSCVGALSVTGLKVDVPLREVHQLGSTVREHADRLSALLGGIRPEGSPS